MVKRIKITSILLIIIYCVLSIASILMLHHLNVSDTLSRMGTGSFGESYAFISLNSDYQDIHIIEDDLSNHAKEYAICSDNTHPDGLTIRFIVFNKKYATFPLKEGRFFFPSDFYDGNNIAVVGKNYEDLIYNEDGKRRITLNGTVLDVIGVLGYDDATLFDNYIFVNYYSDLPKESKVIMIDYFSTNDAAAISDTLVGDLHIKEIEAEVLTMGERFSESIMPKIHVARWLLALLSCCFLGILLVSLEWIRSYRYEVCVRRLVGASIKSEIIRLLVKYCIIAGISFIVSVIYCVVFHPDYLRLLFVGFVITVPIILVFLGYAIYRIIVVPIGEAIK